ncbi:type II toxin-antitoxin system Phd/YefM family antitoxin [Mesorhizobium sp. M0220]|uniref:type II toxin-antitoxin system Phd/YefM family antitoxin n=1 Tax=unclassified Mesorhizobium TaxID=325217 RepID=UPI003338C20C
MREISLKDARTILSALLDQVVAGEPAVITRRGSKQAVILSFQNYEKLARVPSFGQLPGSISR